jgi:hypothetical protein
LVKTSGLRDGRDEMPPGFRADYGDFMPISFTSRTSGGLSCLPGKKRIDFLRFFLSVCFALILPGPPA